MSEVHRYPPRVLLLDGLRACLGVSITFGPLLFLTVGWPLTLALVVSGLIFLWFGLRVLAQSVFSIVPSTQGLSSRGVTQQFLAWEDLKDLKLAYYAPRRRREAGWYQLTLLGACGSIRLESTLSGFDELLQRAVIEAARAGIAFDPSTCDNLAAWTKQGETP